MKEEKELIERISKLESRLDKLENVKNVHPAKVDMENVKVGNMSYCGKYASPDGHLSSSFSGDVGLTQILKVNSKDLAQVVDALSSEERIDIVKLLLKKSSTAKEIMEILNFPTTGKVYHHLSFLEKLGIIRKDNEQYLIKGKSVSGVLFMILGASKILKDRGEDYEEN